MQACNQGGKALRSYPIRLALIVALGVGTPHVAAGFGQADDPLNSSKVLKLTTFATYASAFAPESAIDLTHPKDGSGRIFVSTNQGKIHTFSSSGTSLGTFLDFNTAGVPDFDSSLGFTTRGLSYIAFHPDYGTAGAPGEGKLYTFYKTNVPGVRSPDYSGAELPTRPGDVLTQYAIVEWTVDAENPNRIDTMSRREVIRFEVGGPAEDTHSIGEISFNPFAMPGQADYGNLYLSLGDASAGPALKNVQHAQDLDNPFGTVLRINPLQNGSDPYSVPADNPFHDGGSLLDNDNNVEEIAAWGFRYPQNFSFAKGTCGNHRMIVFDIGAGDFEEVNIVDLGDNHGWSRHDGPVDGNMKTVLKLPPGSTLEFPATVYDHNIPNLPGATPTEGSAAISGGFVVSDPGDPGFQNQVVFSDLPRGAFFHADFEDLLAADAANTQASMSVMAVSLDGSPAGLFRDLIGKDRGDARFGVDERGRLFIISRLTNEIYLTNLIADQTAGDTTADAIVVLSGGALEHDPERDKAAVREALEKWVQAYNSRDLQGSMAVWSEEVIGWYPGSPDSHYRSRRDGHERSFADDSIHVEYSVVIDEIQVSGDMAFVRDTWTQTVTRAGSSEVTRTKEKSFEIWRREKNGTWKIIRWIAYPEPQESEQ